MRLFDNCNHGVFGICMECWRPGNRARKSDVREVGGLAKTYKKGAMEVTEHRTTGNSSKCHIMKTVSLATLCTTLVIINIYYIHAAHSAKINLSLIDSQHISALLKSKYIWSILFQKIIISLFRFWQKIFA